MRTGIGHRTFSALFDLKIAILGAISVITINPHIEICDPVQAEKLFQKQKPCDNGGSLRKRGQLWIHYVLCPIPVPCLVEPHGRGNPAFLC